MKQLLEFVVKHKLNKTYINPIEKDCHVDLSAKPDYHNLGEIEDWIISHCNDELRKVHHHKTIATCNADNYIIGYKFGNRVMQLATLHHDKVCAIHYPGHNPSLVQYNTARIIGSKLGMIHNESDRAEWIAPKN